MTLSHVMQSMDDTFADTANVYRDELLQIKMKILFLEVDNIFHYRIVGDDAKDDTDTSRQQYLFRQFLSDCYLRMRSVSTTVDFYADKLCIIHAISGSHRAQLRSRHKVYNLIARAVVGEIEIMLADSSIPLKQIATDMNFSDQSVFTKFFKRQTGMSPLQYRNTLK
jgi:AraC family transcriptional activator of pobA